MQKNPKCQTCKLKLLKISFLFNKAVTEALESSFSFTKRTWSDCPKPFLRPALNWSQISEEDWVTNVNSKFERVFSKLPRLFGSRRSFPRLHRMPTIWSCQSKTRFIRSNFTFNQLALTKLKEKFEAAPKILKLNGKSYKYRP